MWLGRLCGATLNDVGFKERKINAVCLCAHAKVKLCVLIRFACGCIVFTCCCVLTCA